MANEYILKGDVQTVKKDRMRFTKNKLSSTFCYLAILFNVLYFVEIYTTDIGNYYYTMHIGFSIVYNLLFLLFTFLCSEGVKNYSSGYSIFLIIIGAMQLVRIVDIPMKAHAYQFSLDGKLTYAMDDNQFMLVIGYLVVSAAFCIAAGIIGIVKHIKLENYKAETGLS